MIRLRFLLALLLLAGPVAPRPAAAAPRALDCPLCGHVCCCPDVCREILKERRACAAGSLCRLGADDGQAAFSPLGPEVLAPTLAAALERPIPFVLRARAAAPDDVLDGGRDAPAPLTPPPRA